MKKCKYCKNEINKKDKVCQHCGKKVKSPILTFIIIILIIIVISNMGNDDKKEYKITNGKLESYNESCLEFDDDLKCVKTCANIKAKIEPLFTNESTINQNYYNVEDFIKKYNGNKFDVINYWAVADMTDGSEAKVISFSLNKKIIDGIYDEKIYAHQLDEYIDDLWIIPSLKK